MPKAIRSPEQKKKIIVDNDKAQGTIVQSGKMTDSTNDPSKATNDKALKASVAALINSTTQYEPTIPTAAHVGCTCVHFPYTYATGNESNSTNKRSRNDGYCSGKKLVVWKKSK